MNNKRTGKFYRKNEAEVMKSLGLLPTKNSGSGWIEKEDGQNDFVICQLKSTDAQSIKVNQKDIRILEYNASIENKLPIFAIQFLNTDEVWLMAKPIDFAEISKYIETGKCEIQEQMVVEEMKPKIKKVIGSSAKVRDRMTEDRKARYEKKSKSAI